MIDDGDADESLVGLRGLNGIIGLRGVVERLGDSADAAVRGATVGSSRRRRRAWGVGCG